MGPGLGANELVAPTSTGFHGVEQAPKYGCCQCLCPQGEPQLPPTSLGDSSRPAGSSGPGSYEVTTFALGPGAHEVLCAPFKSGVGTSLVAQWIRLCAANAGGLGSIPGQGTRSHMHAATKSSHATTTEPVCRN